MSAHQYETINFGKHKGKAWEDIPDSYLNWMIENGDPDKAGTQIASDEMEMRKDEGRSVPDDETPSKPRAAAEKQHNSAPAGTPINKWCEEMEVRMNRLEAAVFKKTEPVKPAPKKALEPMSFADDDIAF